MIHPVILSGGSGTRLWPVSRQNYPKQFVTFGRADSLYQATLKRFAAEGFAEPLILTIEAYRFLAAEQAVAAGCTDAGFLIEPAARDTAPALLAAALVLTRTDPEALMLAVPSDHIITDLGAFHAALAAAAPHAAAGHIVTFGVTPERPETGFGYLQVAETPQPGTAVPLASFREKPDLASAEALLAEGRSLWNAGLFLARPNVFIEAFRAAAPDILAPVQAAVDQARIEGPVRALQPEAFGQARAVSFDYAVMEQAKSVLVVPMECGWSDLSAWDGRWAVAERDRAGVATEGAVTARDCTGSYLVSAEPGMQMVGIGLTDVIAVAMRDAVLVADRSRAQDLRQAVTDLREAEVPQASEHPRFHRPWGWYETLCLAPRFQVKQIMVKPGGVLSLQSHLHRAEHWVVVAGTAEVTIGEKVTHVTENESVYIPLGQRHRLANPGKVPVHLIEVQTGAYLGEDDITRYEDIYSRV